MSEVTERCVTTSDGTLGNHKRAVNHGLIVDVPAGSAAG